MTNSKEFRIVFLPPMYCATIECISNSPEVDSLNAVFTLISDYGLLEKKPDIRHFGFSPSYDNTENKDIGAFERWVTIPENMDVPHPFKKKKVEGGLYAALMVAIGNFDKITPFMKELNDSNEFELLSGNDESLLEEYLNTFLAVQADTKDFFKQSQIDLLVKIKPR